MTVPERWPAGASFASAGNQKLTAAAANAAHVRLACLSAESSLLPKTLSARILLAEDDPDNRRWLSLILERAGAEVTAVVDGLAAVEQATAAWQRDEPFDLIVMDVLMPRLDGLQATRQLRAAGYRHPIVALTAWPCKATANDAWPPAATSTPPSPSIGPPW